ASPVRADGCDGGGSRLVSAVRPRCRAQRRRKGLGERTCRLRRLGAWPRHGPGVGVARPPRFVPPARAPGPLGGGAAPPPVARPPGRPLRGDFGVVLISLIRPAGSCVEGSCGQAPLPWQDPGKTLARPWQDPGRTYVVRSRMTLK